MIAGYLVFSVSAVLLFELTGHEPDASPDLAFGALSIAYGAAFAILSGFITGAIAKRSELRHASVLAGLIALGALLSLVAQLGEASVWTQIASLVVFAPAAALGGYLSGARRKRMPARQAGAS